MRISELAAAVSERLLSELATEMAEKKSSTGCVFVLYTGRVDRGSSPGEKKRDWAEGMDGANNRGPRQSPGSHPNAA